MQITSFVDSDVLSLCPDHSSCPHSFLRLFSVENILGSVHLPLEVFPDFELVSLVPSLSCIVIL